MQVAALALLASTIFLVAINFYKKITLIFNTST